MKKIVFFKLKLISKLILWRHKPKIIGITGSVGKTSAKDAIYEVLKNNFDVYVSEKNMNTETGLPLTIFRVENPKNIGNPFSWIKVFLHGTKQIFANDYPKVLILEYGIDSPGDMDYLLSIVKPDISIITGISTVHTDSLGNKEKIFEEKSKLVTDTPGSIAILNTDFDQLRVLAKNISNEKKCYGYHPLGFKSEDCIYAENAENTLKGLKLDIKYNNKSYALQTKLFGNHSAYSLLVSFAVGIEMGMKAEDIIMKLKGYETTIGRMHILDGINGSIVIDDSYNSSPEAVIKAIESVEKLKKDKRIILVLGSMNELGAKAEESHKRVGIKAGDIADIIVTIGDMANKWIAWSSLGRGFSKSNVHTFSDPFEAGKYLKENIKKGDLVLVKGSQNGVFSEEVVKVIMDKKYRPEEVLVRQGEDWMKKKNKMKK